MDLPYLLIAAGSLGCVLPLGNVVETMRPLPVEPLETAPSFVLGMSLIRGEPTPVVDLRALLGRNGGPTPSRFVTLRAGGRTVAIAVDRVEGIRELPPSLLAEAPPLLGVAQDGLVEAIGALDASFLLLLRGVRLLPDGALPAGAGRSGG